MIGTIGDLLEDVVVILDGPLRRATDTDAEVLRRRGGSAANVAALAAMSGTPARFIGQVGSDTIGYALEERMRDSGVDTRLVHRGRTGTIVVLVESGGERSMLTDRGSATQLLGVEHDVLDDLLVLHVPAYSLVVDPLATATLELIGEAVSRSIPVTVDASSVALIDEFGVVEFRELLERVRPSVLFCNRQEAIALGIGRRGSLPGAHVTIIKAGARPTVAVRADGRSFSVPVEPADEVVDTTGAGDAFAAGFLSALCDRCGAKQAIERAHRLAAEVIARPGASLSTEPSN